MPNHFDQIWIENRLRYRKRLTGSAMRMDEVTGYLEPATRRGFSAEEKQTFIKRYTVCSNFKQCTKSVNVDVQTVYDAIAIDKRFREDIIKCNEIVGRKKQLNDELVKLAVSEKVAVLSELSKEADKYLGN